MIIKLESINGVEGHDLYYGLNKSGVEFYVTRKSAATDFQPAKALEIFQRNRKEFLQTFHCDSICLVYSGGENECQK